jgi:hypothetical protein
MKRTLAISLLLGLAATAAAQTPKAVEKVVSKSASTVRVAAQKPAPGTKSGPVKVKVVAVSAVKPAPMARPAVVAVQPHAVKVQVAPKVVAAPPHRVAAAQESRAKRRAVSVRPMPVVAVSATKNPFRHAHKTHTAAVKSAHAAAEGKKSEDVKVAASDKKTEAGEKKKSATIGAAGRRDPFVSPVVNMAAVGSGCSSGKRCLAIDQIALRGVVKSEAGMIAVVVNSMDKAYFLRENDPVFNGYVVKITEDSIVFKETFHDRLGKAATRDVTKTINRPVA